MLPSIQRYCTGVPYMPPDRQELRAESQTIKYPPVASALHTIRKLKSMNVNLSSIARNRTASRRQSPNNLHRAPRKMIGFCTPHVGPLPAMQNVNRTGATTSMVTKRRPPQAKLKNPRAPNHFAPRVPNHQRKTRDCASLTCCSKSQWGVLSSTAIPAEINPNPRLANS